MQLSDHTKKILENFVLINDGIVIKPTPEGADSTLLRIISKTKSVYAEVVIPEKFENMVSLYDLPTFLSLNSSLDMPELDFGPTQVTLKKNNSISKLTYASPEVIIHPVKAYPEVEAKLTFNLKQVDLGKLLEVAKIIRAPNLKLYSKNGKLYFSAFDIKNVNGNTYEIEVGTGESETEYFFKRDLLNVLIPGEYEVSVTDKFAVFDNESVDTLKYVIILENVNG